MTASPELVGRHSKGDCLVHHSDQFHRPQLLVEHVVDYVGHWVHLSGYNNKDIAPRQ